MSKAVTKVKPNPIAVALPNVILRSSPLLSELTKALGVPRDVLADDEQIKQALSQLPRLIERIPSNLRDERIVRMCVAVASGLFDAAINYIWNAAVLELREKVRRFGINVVPQVIDDKAFDEDSLLDLKDAELLDLCLKLNLIGDDDFFFLDQCRATRNSFSVAHPAQGVLDEDEVVSFLSRCQKHALSSERNPKGVDTKTLLTSLKASKFTNDQHEEWSRRIKDTFDAQRELLFVMLHGIYCDPASGEEARLNALALCDAVITDMSPKAKSALVDRHQEYKAKGDDARLKASLKFFEGIRQLALLSEAEVHAVFTSASNKLLSAHNGWDNFLNEPPFAERLLELSTRNPVPDTAQLIFVDAVITAAIGNTYGVSRAASPSYDAIVRSFSPNEVRLMLELAKGVTVVANRIATNKGCELRYRALVSLIDPKSVPTSAKSLYAKWLPKH